MGLISLAGIRSTLPINQSSVSRLKHSTTDWLPDLLRLWALALVFSAALVAAGERWPQSLQPDGRWVGLLLLGLPLSMGLLLASRWRLPTGPLDRDRGESGD